MNNLRPYVHWQLLLVGLFLAISGYYWMEWRTFTNFVSAIDHSSQFMDDFVSYYYPMSKKIIQETTPVFGYYYTSFFALLLVPIGLMPMSLAMVTWGVIQFTCVVTLCIVPARSLLKLPPSKIVLYAGLCATSFPVLHSIKWGQMSVPLTVCTIVAFVLYNKNNRVIAGVLLAFAAAIKFYPALFIIYFILKRDVCTCLVFVFAAFIFYFAFPATLLGVAAWLDFEKAASAGFRSAEWLSNDVNSQYFAHVGLRWITNIFERNAGDTLAQVLTIAGYVVAASCIAMVWFLQQRESCEKFGLSMVAIFLSIPFIIKTSWPHYFAYLPLCQVAVFSYFISRFRVSDLREKALNALPVLSMLCSSIFLFNIFPDWRMYNSYGMLFISNFLLLIALYAILALCDE